MPEKVQKSRSSYGGSKSSLAEAAGAGLSGRDGRSKIARDCGMKDTSESKYAKHLRSGAVLAGNLLKKCTQLRREAISKSNC